MAAKLFISVVGAIMLVSGRDTIVIDNLLKSIRVKQGKILSRRDEILNFATNIMKHYKTKYSPRFFLLC
jgi:hypothetical protein